MSSQRQTLAVVVVTIVVLLVAGGVTAAVVLSDDDDTAAKPSERGTLVPDPAPGEQPTPTADPTPAPTTTPAGTRGLNPCDLVTGPDATRLGLGAGEKDSLVPRTCTWDLATPGDTVRVWIEDTIGLAVVPRGGRSLRIGEHDAIRSPGPTVGPLHSCQVAIGVTGTSRIDVVVSSSAGQSLACSVAIRTARLVEPNLP
jgi:hypothetical protein